VRHRVAFSLLLLAGCAREPSARQAPSAASAPATATTAAAPPAPPAKFVLARFGLPLYSRPEASALVQAERSDTEPVEYADPYRFVAEHGDFVELESLGDGEDAHCTWSGSFEGVRVRFFVRRADLVALVTRAFDASWPNGTAISLLPGVPLEATGGGAYSVGANGFRFPLALPGDTVGITYQVAAHVPEAVQPRYVQRDAPMRFGDGLVPIEIQNANTYVYREAKHEAGLLVELRSRCARLTVLVAPSAIHTGDPPEAIGLEPAPPRQLQPDRWRAPAGTTLYWPDGSAAGSVVAALTLSGEGDMVGSRRCYGTVRGDFYRSAFNPEKRTMVLCFDADRLALWPEHQSDAAAAAVGPDTRRYVVVTVVNHTASSNDEVVAAVHAALKNELLTAPGYAIAPAGETAAESERIVAERGLAGFRLEVEVPKLVRYAAKPAPPGVVSSGAANVAPTLRLFRFPSGERLDEHEDNYGTSPGEQDGDAQVLKEALLYQLPRFRRKMEH
jgi:hypothetical protein